MSRSYKHQPFQAICGDGSAKRDKQLAAQGVRRAFRHALHTTTDFEDFLPPHRYECAWNETYSWGRDGNQGWRGLDADDLARHYAAIFDQGSIWYGDADYMVWPPAWYARMMRK